MDNECEVCGKNYNKLSQLYMHKQTHKPSLILHQHPHPAFGMEATQIVPKRKREDDKLPIGNKFQILDRKKDDEDDTDLEIIDSYDRVEKKREQNERG